MWALPDIRRLNANAALNADKLCRAARRRRKPNCEHWGCTNKAEVSYLIHDIFSDDPKGVLHLCGTHDGYSGDPMEGYFTCAHCNRVLMENYTWELYYVELDDDKVCLNCAAESYFADPRNWIMPQAVQKVVLQARRSGPLFDSNTGVLNLARCRHVLGVEQPLPASVAFVDNAEFDGGNGHQISGDNLLDVIRRLHQPFCPVLDAAYQFAVSIGVYVRNGQHQRLEQKEEA